MFNNWGIKDEFSEGWDFLTRWPEKCSCQSYLTCSSSQILITKGRHCWEILGQKNWNFLFPQSLISVVIKLLFHGVYQCLRLLLLMEASETNVKLLHSSKILLSGTSLAVQWLGLCALTAEGPGSIPGQGTKIPQASRCSKKKKKKNPVLLG